MLLLRVVSVLPPLRGEDGRGDCKARPWLSCRVHGPVSLWNINMTRNIISHDSRRCGNTKYYPAEAPAGRSATPAALLLAVFCSWQQQQQQPAGHAAVTKRDDKLAFARHDVAAKSMGARERSRETGCARALGVFSRALSRFPAASADRTIERSQLLPHRETLRRFLHLSFARV